MVTLEMLYERAENDLNSYAASRANAVRLGTETAELAGLLMQKYGQGLAKALYLATELADDQQPNLQMIVNKCVDEIDPNWILAQEVRSTARPAGIQITPPAPGTVIRF